MSPASRVRSTSESGALLAKMAIALRKITEVLGRELGSPTKNAPVWTEFEWRIARSVAAMHGVSSLLRDSPWIGPKAWRQFLDEQRCQSVARHSEITRLLDEIDCKARHAGIALVALKGAALYASGIYTAGERPMGDIDLLIRNDDARVTARLLEGCGYVASFNFRRHQVFEPSNVKVVTRVPLGEHIDSPIKIEVHTKISEHLPVAAADITQCIYPRRAHAGLNSYPSVRSLMMHLILHAAGNIRARALRLVQLHDIAALAARFSVDDWCELTAARLNGGALWWAFPPLVLTARYYPGAIPPAVLASLEADCPWLLRQRARHQRLTDVSWSNILIEAFPGLEWSRTPWEALEFMSSRIRPSREALSELQEGAAQIPGSHTVGWYESSHRARILRWIFSRPPRVQTLLSVRAALSQGDNEFDASTPTD
jgi:Uncharacterised nucleotidyltransferase